MDEMEKEMCYAFKDGDCQVLVNAKCSNDCKFYTPRDQVKIGVLNAENKFYKAYKTAKDELDQVYTQYGIKKKIKLTVDKD